VANTDFQDVSWGGGRPPSPSVPPPDLSKIDHQHNSTLADEQYSADSKPRRYDRQTDLYLDQTMPPTRPSPTGWGAFVDAGGAFVVPGISLELQPPAERLSQRLAGPGRAGHARRAGQISSKPDKSQITTTAQDSPSTASTAQRRFAEAGVRRNRQIDLDDHGRDIRSETVSGLRSLTSGHRLHRRRYDQTTFCRINTAASRCARRHRPSR